MYYCRGCIISSVSSLYPDAINVVLAWRDVALVPLVHQLFCLIRVWTSSIACGGYRRLIYAVARLLYAKETSVWFGLDKAEEENGRR